MRTWHITDGLTDHTRSYEGWDQNINNASFIVIVKYEQSTEVWAIDDFALLGRFERFLHTERDVRAKIVGTFVRR